MQECETIISNVVILIIFLLRIVLLSDILASMTLRILIVFLLLSNRVYIESLRCVLCKSRFFFSKFDTLLRINKYYRL